MFINKKKVAERQAREAEYLPEIEEELEELEELVSPEFVDWNGLED